MSLCENIVYHYCKTDTLIKILQNKTIRVSDCNKSNDYSEAQWVVTSMVDTIIDMILTDVEFCEIYDYDNKLYDKVKETISAEIDGVFLRNSRDMYTFISCFSEAGDILSQWRGYADNGKGVAIGFNKELLLSFDTNAYNYFFKKVIYNEKEQREYIGSQILSLVNAYKKDQNEFNVPKVLNEFLVDISYRIATFRNDSPFFKNSAFSEEKEWRLIINNHYRQYNCGWKNSIDDVGTIDENYSEIAKFKNGFVRYPLQFTTSSDNLIPYFDICFAKIKDELIKKIYIGPRCNINERDIRLFLESEGFGSDKIKIIKSKATYR